MQSSDGRPIYLNLMKIKLPMPGLISIFHRATGILLALSIPLFAYLFGLSLSSESGFSEAQAWVRSPLLIPVFIVLLWSFVHHLFAGIRYLFIDIGVGVEKDFSYKSSFVVMYGALFVTAIVAWGIWL